MFILQHDEDDGSFLFIIDHGKGTMSELTGRVGCRMDARNLHEFLCHVGLREETGTLGQTE